jgi:D-glycero-D-manno-heptose 1,7-bisphosphate phosphatase
MVGENKAIFLDRDGVINQEVNYLSKPEDFEFIEGSIDALKILQALDYLLIIITNQAGIARGYFSLENLNAIHDKMLTLLKQNGVTLTDIFFCPHHPDFTGSCDCRKPKPGMVLNASKKHSVNLNKSYMVGDTLIDIETGFNAGCKTVLVLTGYGTEELKKANQIKPDFIFKNLLEFAKNLKFNW